MSLNQKLLARLMECQDMALGYRDDRDCPKEYANYESNDDLLHEAEYILGTYFEGSGGHDNSTILREEDPKAWRSEVSKVKRLIASVKKEMEK